MRKVTEFIGLPDVVPNVGDVFDIILRQVDSGDETPWQITVYSLDNDSMIVETHECGGPVAIYRHRIEIENTTPTTLREILTIDAGAATDFVVAYSKDMYLKRHLERHRLLTQTPQSR